MAERRPRPPRNMEDGFVEDLFPPKFLKPEYDFNNKSQVVQINRVMQEQVWNKHENKFDTINVMYFENIERGIKIIKEQSDMLYQRFGRAIKDWQGKTVRIVPTTEKVAGKTHKLMRVSEEELPQEEPEPVNMDPVTKDQLEELIAYGYQLYAEEWAERQETMALYISNERVRTLEELYEDEAAALLSAIEDKLISENEEEINNPEEVSFMEGEDE